jgi:uncharacterized membrane protein
MLELIESEHADNTSHGIMKNLATSSSTGRAENHHEQLEGHGDVLQDFGTPDLRIAAGIHSFPSPPWPTGRILSPPRNQIRK